MMAPFEETNGPPPPNQGQVSQQQQPRNNAQQPDPQPPQSYTSHQNPHAHLPPYDYRGGAPHMPPLQRQFSQSMHQPSPQQQQPYNIGQYRPGMQPYGKVPSQPTTPHRASSAGSANAYHMPPGMPPPQQQQKEMSNGTGARGQSSPGQQQQQYGGSSMPAMNGGWQSDKDTDHRRQMIQLIAELLKKDRRDSPDQGGSKVAQMAKQLEVSLYRSAPTFASYMDRSTLKQRLQQIAMEVSRKAKSSEKSISSRISSSSQHEKINGNANKMVNMNDINPMANGGGSKDVSQPSRSDGSTGSSKHHRDDREWKIRIRHKQQRLLLLHHSAKCTAVEGKCSVTPHCADMKRLWRHMEGCKDNNCRVSHCFSSRAILSHYRKCRDPQCPACGPVRETVRRSRTSQQASRSSSGPMMNDMRAMPPAPSVARQQDLHGAPPSGAYPPGPSYRVNMPPPVTNPPSAQNSAPGSDMSLSMGGATKSSGGDPFISSRDGITTGGDGSRRNDSEWQKIRHKQQRLLLLRHASRCQYGAGKCPVTPHCAAMKKLWGHIATCKNQNCSVQHCLSSRYVLSHYRRCKDPKCPACGPVREQIRKSHDREKMKQQAPTASLSSQNAVGSGSIMAPESIEPQRKRQKVRHDAPNDVSSIRAGGAPRPPSGKPVGTSERSLLEGFSFKELETHLKSLERKMQLTPAKLKSKCSEILRGLQTHQHGWVFNQPVNPVELGLPDYFDIIKKPMDLGSVQKRLDEGKYHSFDDFTADVHLTFDNAMMYNEDGSVVYEMAKELKIKFENDKKKLASVLEAEDRQRRQNERACTLCGCEKLFYEPPVYFCNGMNCQSTRIRRNSHFYIAGNNQYFWCTSCYNELDGKIPIELAEFTIMKADLVKKKNDEVHEESWVQCDTCERWVHQICGLFNTRQNKDARLEYNCPACLLRKRRSGRSAPTTKPPGAVELPRTMLSEWLEQHVARRVTKKKRELAEDKAQTENIALSQAMRQVEAGEIIIRQVTSTDRKLEVRELMQKRYAHKKYPSEFPFRCKCLLVFQRLDGVDVVLFALYLYEHGEDNPAPNQRVVYISYLDSVHFMKPRRVRTFIYHEILIAYLDYVRRKGFSKAHIWACPPLKGDDYIFYAKPEDQKTPRDARLRQWYIDMLVEGQKRNIVGKVTNMYDEYFADDSLDATSVPYLEGDYFPGEAENIIKMIEDSNDKKGGKKKKGSKKSKATGTRSTGVDEAALLDSGLIDLKDLDRDQVMVKLGETIQPMKDSFIVAYLNWTGARDEDMVIPSSIEKARVEYQQRGESDLAGSKRDAVGSIRDSIASVKDKNGEPAKLIDDDEEDLDCEILNNRQAFLNLCRGNHYQFDELRRAKHTSMMVLWHLHNRDAAKFVQQCVCCGKEILSGRRWHCNTCPDYDLCQECYSSPYVNRGACNHKLVAIAVESDSEKESGGSAEERKKRQRNLQLHIQLIEHAASCTGKCTSTNCMKMKQYFKHQGVCKIKVSGGCRICKRIWTLLRIHAQKCKKHDCPIPNCLAIREKMRQLQKQQQAMDDRRRIEMNRHMRFGGSER